MSLLVAGAVAAGLAAGSSLLALSREREPDPPRTEPSAPAQTIVPAAMGTWSLVLALPVLQGKWLAAGGGLLLCAAAAPALLARSRERHRVASLRRELPALLDSLVLRTEAGMPLASAILGSREVFPRRSPTAAHIEMFARDLELGRTAVEALRAMRARMRQCGADGPLGALIRGLELGTPVRAILAEQSERARQSLLTEAERFANSLSIRLLVPLLLFVFPASFLVILSPVIVFLLGSRP